jgi:hypothetical protein
MGALPFFLGSSIGSANIPAGYGTHGETVFVT